MNTDELNKLYFGIAAMLRRHGFEWLVDEVERTAQRGTVVRSTELQDVPSEVSSLTGAMKRSGLAPRNVIRDLSPQERMNLILDALDSAICGPTFLLEGIFKLLRVPWDGHLSLAPDEQGNGEISFSYADVETRITSAQSMRTLIDELRKEINGSVSN